jgi:putative ABC transport system permease protein
MPIKTLIRIAIRSIKANKSRSLLTTLGVIIGVASVIILVAVGSGLKDFITNQMQDIGSNLVMVMPGDIDLDDLAGGGAISSSFVAMSASKLKVEHMIEIEREVPYVKDTVAFIVASSPIRYGGESVGIQVLGTTEKFADVINIEFAKGGFLANTDVKSGKKVAVLGHKAADELFGDENPVGEKVKLGEYRYTIVGVAEEKGGQSTMSPDDKVFIPLIAAQRQFGQDNVSAILVQAMSTEKVPTVVSLTEQVLERRLDDDDFTILDQKDILSTVSAILGTLTAALGGIAAISLLVGGIGIMNIMLVSVTERTQEIGLRKALGAKPELILTQFLIEAVFLSIGGGIIGILVGAGGAVLLNQFMPVTITLWSVLLAFFVSAGVGIIFGVAPAKKASELSPIEALRYE